MVVLSGLLPIPAPDVLQAVARIARRSFDLVGHALRFVRQLAVDSHHRAPNDAEEADRGGR